MYVSMKMSRPKRQTTSIAITGSILFGSISAVTIRCGKKECACHKDPRMRHGPYYQWTGIVDGKRTTKLIPEILLKECKERIKRYHLLLAKIEALKIRAIKAAPWEHPPSR